MTALVTRTGTLPPTATYAARHWAYTLAVPGDAPDDRAGTLVITLRKGKGEAAEEKKDEYGLEEVPCSTRGVRTFLLLNDTDADQPDVYETALGTVRKCSCKAGLCKLICKHLEALEALTAEGGI